METSRLIVQRNKALWQDRTRDYRVLVDGKELAKVGNDSEVALEVAPGRRRVQLKIDWCRSPVVEVDAPRSGAVRLECGPNAHPLLVLVYITIWMNRYIWLRKA